MRVLGNKKKYLVIIGLSLAIFLVVSAGLFLYNYNLRQSLNSNACDSMNEWIYQQNLVLGARMESNLAYVENLAKTIPYLAEKADTLLGYLDQVRGDSPFTYMLMTDPDGRGYSDNGVKVDISGQPYFQKLLEGSIFFTEPVLSVLDGKTPVIPVSAPIYENGKISGLLVGAYDVDQLKKQLTASNTGKNFSYITDRDGNIIVRSGDSALDISSAQFNENLIDNMEESQIEEHDRTADILVHMQQNQSGHSYLNINHSHWFLHYAPVELNDWYVFLLVPESVIIAQAQSITGDAIMLTLSILGICSMLLWYILCLQRRSAQEKRRYTEQVERIAYYDHLTQIPNLYRFKQLADERMKKQSGENLFLCKFDIANFKAVNEIFGFDVGNEVLRMVAAVIQVLQRERPPASLLCCRVSGDEFAIMDQVVLSREERVAQLQRFEHLFRERAQALLGDHTVLFRFGRYFLEPEETDIDVVIEKANLAHRAAKKQKTSNYCNYDSALRAQFMRRVELESKMEEALRERAFKVYLQPKFDLKTEVPVGAEALVRWQDKDGTTISPGEFIPLFEKNGLVTKLDMYMLDATCALLREWMDGGMAVVPVSINFSRLHLYNPNFVEDIKGIVAKYDVPKRYIEIEITESVFFENEEALEELLLKIHDGGFTLSMDDFGTGYSSLGLLKNLPIDVIKIDRSFFMANKYKTRAKAVIETVIDMARKLGMKTVAEGVETVEHITLLREVGCDIVQGYYYAKPVPAAEFFIAAKLGEKPLLEEPKLEVERLSDLLEEGLVPGERIPVEVHQLFQYTIRDTLCQRYGEGEASDCLRYCGRMAGQIYTRRFMDCTLPFVDFMEQFREHTKETRVGMIEVEQMEESGRKILLRLKNTLSSFGAEHNGNALQQYDEGFLAGILQAYSKREYTVTEVTCLDDQAGDRRFLMEVQ